MSRSYQAGGTGFSDYKGTDAFLDPSLVLSMWY